jgi:WD40 repeat protein
MVYGVAISHSGKYLATASEDRTVRVWDLATGKPVRSYEGHADYVMAVAFSADDRFLLSASKDRTVRAWKAPR